MSQKNKMEIDKKRVISSNSEAHLPVIIQREPVVIQKLEPIDNNLEKQIPEDVPKKKKLTTLKKKILNEEKKDDITSEKDQVIDIGLNDELVLPVPVNDVSKEESTKSSLIIDNIFVSEDNVLFVNSIQTRLN